MIVTGSPPSTIRVVKKPLRAVRSNQTVVRNASNRQLSTGADGSVTRPPSTPIPHGRKTARSSARSPTFHLKKISCRHATSGAISLTRRAITRRRARGLLRKRQLRVSKRSLPVCIKRTG